jgi:GT2 family glycosyltransferase
VTVPTRLVLDPRVRVLGSGRTLLGGDPWRVLRLTEGGAEVLRKLLGACGAAGGGGGGGGAAGSETGKSAAGDDAAAEALARRLIDAGLAHPRPTRASTATVTVILPVRDRPVELARCLGALFAADAPGRVLVVDDGSRDAGAVADVCARHGCELIRRQRPGGPAAARNTALVRIESGLVALLDSDCVPEPGWLSLLCGALADDPVLGAVAPRVRPLSPSRTGAGAEGDPTPGARGELYWRSGPERFPAPSTPGTFSAFTARVLSVRRPRAAGPGRARGFGALARFAMVRSPLDLGPWPSLVRPGGRTPYTPTAALLVRREALGATGAPFDPALRYGEDVDLIWRMVERGRPVRYEPAAVVRHGEPERIAPWLARRFRYGSSAGPLACRHPSHLAPVALHPRSVAVLATATMAMTAHRRPVIATASIAAHVAVTVRRLSRHGIPAAAAAPLALRGLGESAAALGRTATMFGPEPLAATLAASHVSPRTRSAMRALARCPAVHRAALALLLASPVHEYARLRPPLDPLRFTALAIADDVAYGAGVWAGSIRARTWRPLRPRLVR